MTININKVQTDMLNKTQQKPFKKQILSYTQQEWQSQILDFSKNLESYPVLDWILWDRQWVFHAILSFTKENMNFFQCIQIAQGILFFVSSSN